MTVDIVVSFVMTGFRQFTTDIADMTYRGMEYNIAIQLNGDDTEALHEMSEQLTSGSDGTFHKIRKASFRLG